ncbi:MAG: hypothetical protein ACOYYJ_13685, partial [Chloroflexota bacterium]
SVCGAYFFRRRQVRLGHPFYDTRRLYDLHQSFVRAPNGLSSNLHFKIYPERGHFHPCMALYMDGITHDLCILWIVSPLSTQRLVQH